MKEQPEVENIISFIMKIKESAGQCEEYPCELRNYSDYSVDEYDECTYLYGICVNN